MSWEPYTGRRVVCVDDSWQSQPGSEVVPKLGGLYTIREAVPSVSPHTDQLFVRLFEIVNRPRRYIDGFFEMTFDIQAFKPLDERATDISVFKEVGAPRKLERVR